MTSGEQYEILRDQQRAALDSSVIERALRRGDLWRYTYSATLSNGDAFDTVIENPTDDDIYVGRVIRTAEGVSGTIEANVSIDTSGTALNALNLRVTSPADTDNPVTAEQGGSYSSPEASENINFPTGSGVSTRGGIRAANLVLGPDANVRYNLTSNADGNEFSFEAVVAIPSP